MSNITLFDYDTDSVKDMVENVARYATKDVVGYHLTQEFTEWCNDHLTGEPKIECIGTKIIAIFLTDDDAVLFRLKWL